MREYPTVNGDMPYVTGVPRGTVPFADGHVAVAQLDVGAAEAIGRLVSTADALSDGQLDRRAEIVVISVPTKL